MTDKTAPDLPNPKEETIIVDGCICGKSRLLMTKERYYSSDTSDDRRRGTMRDYGLAWVDLLDGYILEINGVNSTIPYRRPSTSIVKRMPLTEEQETRRKKRLEFLAKGHPGLYEVIRVIAEKEKMEPIEIVLARLDTSAKKKKLEGLEREKARKQDSIVCLDKQIRKLNADM